MNSWSEFAAGDYMKAADIKGSEPILTIVGFGTKTFEAKDGKAEQTKPYLKFAETDQQLTVNATNAKTLGVLFGDNPEHSKGKRVQLMVVKTSMGDSIQIKEIQLNGGAAPVTPRPGGSLKGDAFAKFKERNTGVPTAEQGKKFVADLAAMFPGLSPQNLTDDHFTQYIRSFDAAATAFKDDDIPF
jgi:hypothetical protein